ncbi:hypothetical protein TNCV_802771 [Trichonephila clavipes]|nr:hypothetical protein TNCV_802771 [Trichonephila clavipes]
MHEQEQNIEELESLDPFQSEDRMTIGNLTEDLKFSLKMDLYCQQIDRLKLAIDQKRSESTNRHRHPPGQRQATHVCSDSPETECELGREVLMHPPYSLNLAPSD